MTYHYKMYVVWRQEELLSVTDNLSHTSLINRIGLVFNWLSAEYKFHIRGLQNMECQHPYIHVWLNFVIYELDIVKCKTRPFLTI